MDFVIGLIVLGVVLASFIWLIKSESPTKKTKDDQGAYIDKQGHNQKDSVVMPRNPSGTFPDLHGPLASENQEAIHACPGESFFL
ncbi:hypothetical protein C8P63_1431 [Melghirimyces profundicolus]|uniref:Uncharacterized protein n=1 Tax=Melghirimyces profundicolus TaxID=1242148 RepID=A0A2T6AYI6_9BACL|nr:hypothetical protein [Melghirimyces profundicolus]PTX48880.1 hypothetical protein C8P63_1431 [Melghirimyces profundicolus]